MYCREIDGKTITISPSGWTYKRTFVLVDMETGSLWYPGNGGLMGIQGAHFKKWLSEIKSSDTRWATWKEALLSTNLMK